MSKYLDELRAAAEAEFAAKKAAEAAPKQEEPIEAIPTEVETTQQPEPIIEPAPEPQEQPEEQEQPEVEVKEEPKPARRQVYKKVVDLGDGNPQVFTASTKDELIDKILTAQMNATKRIKELKEERRRLLQNVQPDLAKATSQFNPRSMSQDEELELVNELQTNPSSAISKAVEAVLGAPLAEIRNTLDQIKLKEQIAAVGAQFLASHPEYPVSAKNEQLMADYIKKNNLAWTLKNLELAFADLAEAGLVIPTNAETVNYDGSISELEEPETEVPAVQPVVTPKPVAPVAPAVSAQPTQQPTTSVENVRRRRAVVGVSSNQSAAAVQSESQRELAVEDLLKLPAYEQRRIVLERMKRQS